MIGEHFYHKSIKKVIATFGSIFSDITVKTGQGNIIKVPIHFSQKQKWLEMLVNKIDMRDMNTDIALPVLGFEIVNLSYDVVQMTNPMNVQHHTQDGDNVNFMFSSVPYVIGIELYAATNTLDEAYQIVEQIIPFFTPQLTVTISDVDMHNIKTNITFDLTSISQDIVNEGLFEEKSSIMYNFSFSVHTKFHSNPRSMERIKKVIVNMKEDDHEALFEKLTGTVDGTGTLEWDTE